MDATEITENSFVANWEIVSGAEHYLIDLYTLIGDEEVEIFETFTNVKDGKLARVFRHVGIYAYKRDFLEEFSKMSQTELELGEGIEPLRAMERGYKMRLKETKHSSIGVDLPEHIEKVERVIKGIATLD